MYVITLNPDVPGSKYNKIKKIKKIEFSFQSGPNPMSFTFNRGGIVDFHNFFKKSKEIRPDFFFWS